MTQKQILKWNSYKYNNKLCRDTDGRSGDDESSKPADTGLVTNLEQEPVIANNKIICHAGKSTVFMSWTLHKIVIEFNIGIIWIKKKVKVTFQTNTCES